MMVLVETNFIIEIALKQEQVTAARAILRLAQQSHVELAVPGFSVGEALYALIGKNAERKRALDDLDRQVTQLQRSRHRKPLAIAGQEVARALAQVEREDMNELEHALAALMKVADLIAFERATLRNAVKYSARHGLTMPDAIVYSSAIGHLRERRPDSAILVEGDRHFDDRSIRQELLRLKCAYVRGFDSGLARIRSLLAS